MESQWRKHEEDGRQEGWKGWLFAVQQTEKHLSNLGHEAWHCLKAEEGGMPVLMARHVYAVCVGVYVLWHGCQGKGGGILWWRKLHS